MKKIYHYAKLIVRSITDELEVAEGDENSFDFEQNLITLDFTPQPDFGFARHRREVHKCHLKVDERLWTILHEIGHYMTDDELTEEDYKETEVAKLYCSLVPEDVAMNNPSIQNLYFDTPSEWLATEWAIDYVKHHYLKCKKWSRGFRSY